MAFIAPVIAWAGANAAAIGAVASVATAGAAVYGAASQASAQKKALKASQANIQTAQEQPKVVPLADENSGAVRLRLLQTQRSQSARKGSQSTLVSGSLGDTRPPPIAAPLVLGKAA